MSRVCKLANQSVLLVVESPGGVYNADQLQMVGSFLDEEGLIAKVTEDQRLTLAVGQDQVEAVSARLAEVGLSVRTYGEGMHQPVACLGAQCTFHDQDALGDAFKLTTSLAGRDLGQNSLRIGLNGCAESCVPVHTLDISAIGEMGGYRLSIGGKNSQIPEMAAFVAEGIPSDKLSELINKVIDVYQKHAEEDESLQAVIERVGVSPFVAVLAPYSQDAADDSDPFGDLLAEPAASSADSQQQDSENDESASEEMDFEAELLADLPDEEETDSLIEEDTELDASDAGGLEDLNVSADLDLDQDLGDELLVQEEPGDHLMDINPGEMASGSLAEEVPIGGNNLSEPDFSPEVLEQDGAGDEEEPEVIVDTDDLEEMELDQIEEDVAPAEDALKQLDTVAELEASTPTEEGGDEDLSELDGIGDDLAMLDEIDEDAESELESKIGESIAEQATLSHMTDENLEDRNAALNMVVERELGEDGFDLNSFDQDTSFDADLDELGSDYVEENAQGDEAAFTQMQGMEFDRGRVRIAFASGATLVVDFQRMKDLGGRRSFTVDGQQIDIRIEGEEVFVAVDGVEVNLAIPFAA